MSERAGRRLFWAEGLLALAIIWHGADHVRQARGLWAAGAGVVALEISAWYLALAALWLSSIGHHRASAAAIIAGSWAAFVIALTHLTPGLDSPADPYLHLGLDSLSWAAMLSVPLSGLVVIVAGLKVRRFRLNR